VTVIFGGKMGRGSKKFSLVQQVKFLPDTFNQAIERQRELDLRHRHLQVPLNRHLSEDQDSDIEYLGQTDGPPMLGSSLLVMPRVISRDDPIQQDWWNDHWYTATWRAEQEPVDGLSQRDRAKSIMRGFIRNLRRETPDEWFDTFLPEG
jgi:hypothetical protein